MKNTIFIVILVLIVVILVFIALILREIIRKRKAAKNSIFKNIAVAKKITVIDEPKLVIPDYIMPSAELLEERREVLTEEGTKNESNEVVSMRRLITSFSFRDSIAELPIALGRTVNNKNYILDLDKAPHLLIAGAKGEGKSMVINTIMTSLLYKKQPSELKFVLIDQAGDELPLYSTLENHFLAKIERDDKAIITDNQRATNTLNALNTEMDKRYRLFKAASVKNIVEYNKKLNDDLLNPNEGHRLLPYIVVVIDEFAELITSIGKEFFAPLFRLARLSQTNGIHVIITTQSISKDTITDTLKSHFPVRVLLRVTSSEESEILLNGNGATKLVGQGDMLVSAHNIVTRVQSPVIDRNEIERVTDFICKQDKLGSIYSLAEFKINKTEQVKKRTAINKKDTLFDEAARYFVTNQQCSLSALQRNYKIGLNRAIRIVTQLESAGVVGSQIGNKSRDILIPDLASLEVFLTKLNDDLK